MTPPPLPAVPTPSTCTRDADWWRHAVIYQIYIRSFADGDGDGMGDIAGIRSKIGYLRDLGIDAVWINPWYPSPQADAGYDVADYRAIESMFGDLDQAQALIDELHAAGIRVILDIVPNHTSDQHAWFSRRPPPIQRARARLLRVQVAAPGRVAAEQLARDVRWAGLGPGSGERSTSRGRLLPAPVRAGAARPELGEPGRPRRLRADVALLVRPRGRRVPDRRRARADQGPGLPRPAAGFGALRG